MVVGTAIRVWQFARTDDRSRADVILVLGAAEYNGTPSKILQFRLDHARNLYNEGVAAHVVTVGGKEPGDRYTEAGAGGTYLNKTGVPRDAIVEVKQGRDTLGSARAAAAVLAEHGWHTAVLVSDPWHMLRARAMARDSGIDAWASPTRSGPAVSTRSWQFRDISRETIALLYYRLTKAPADAVGAGRG
ncbi:MAG: YdcF family protein [Sciscionella sp.]